MRLEQTWGALQWAENSHRTWTKLREQHNQVETWFSILPRRALRGASFRSPREVRQALDCFLEAYNPQAAPFAWRKQQVHAVPLKHTYADLRK